MNALVEALNSWASDWWLWLMHGTWQSTLVVLLVLAVVLAGRRWPAPLRYALLLVALVKFAIPPMLSLPTGVFSMAAPEIAFIQQTAEIVLPPAAPAPVPAPLMQESMSPSSAVSSPDVIASPRLQQRSVPLNWQAWLMLTYAAGALVTLLWIVFQWHSLSRLRRSATPAPAGELMDDFQNVAAGLGIRSLPELRVSDRVGSPIAFGIARPTVLLPSAAVERLPRAELKTILAHELAHFRRGDLWVNTFQLCLAVVWWFHPLLWVLQRSIRKVREDCCDDLLLERKLTSRDAYCQVLLSAARELAAPTPSVAALGLGENLHPLGRRLARIMDRTLQRSDRLSIFGLIAILITGGLLLPGLNSTRAKADDKAAPSVPVAVTETPRTNLVDAFWTKSKALDEARAALDSRRGVAPRQPRAKAPVVISPDLKLKSLPELYAEFTATPPPARAVMLIEEIKLRPADEAVPFFTQKLAEENSATAGGTAQHVLVSRSVAECLGWFGGKARSAIPELVRAVRQGDGAAASALCKIAVESDTAIEQLLAAFKDRRLDPRIRTSILQALTHAHLNQHLPKIERALLDEFPHVDRRLQRKISHCLLQSRSTSPEAVAVIERVFGEALADPNSNAVEYANLGANELLEYVRDPRIRWEDMDALQTIQRLGKKAVEAVPSLIELLQDKSRPTNSLVRSAVAASFGKMGAEAKAAVPALVAFLQERGEPGGRMSAVASLRGICLSVFDPTPVPALLDAIADEDKSVSDISVRSLEWFGRNASKMQVAQSEALVPILIDRLSKPAQPQQHSAAAAILGGLQEKGAPAIPSLQRIVAEGPESARTAAEGALRKIQESLGTLSL